MKNNDVIYFSSQNVYNLYQDSNSNRIYSIKIIVLLFIHLEWLNEEYKST